MSGVEPLSHAWREAHCRSGDAALEEAREKLNHSHDLARTLSAIAQAHYAAANVRAKLTPAASAQAYPTALELLDGPNSALPDGS